MAVMKYNPGFLTHDELIESFCVRTQEFESIIEMLRECDSNSNPHRLVIGPRGCGKTSLLLRVAVEIIRDQELSLSLFPIVFSEESYGVANTDEFWLEALYRLAEQTTLLEGDDDLKLTYKELREIRDDRTLGKRCLSTLLDFSNRYGKRLVLIVENLNLMFKDIMDAEAGWKLRHTLQTEPRIILLASATSRFDEIDKSDRAFYDLFVCQTLQPLGTVECAILWESVSGQHRLPDEMRGLRILTGGSPRLLSIIAKFRADFSFRDLMTDLLKLIDDLTEYFKSHIEALPPQERRVYVTLADLWEPATAREVAIQARLGTSKCSALLNRLVERGAVEVVGGGARRKLYYLAERLYNIYYLLRRSHTQKPLIEALIRFMDAYYSPPELRDVGIRMVREASELEPETKTLHWTAFARLIDLPVLAADRKELLSKVPKDFAENFGLELSPAVAESIKSIHPESATSKPDKIITEHDEERDEQAPDEELAIYEEIVRRFGDSNIPTLLEVAADATIRKIFALGRLNRLDEAVIACDEATKPFSARDAPQVVEQVATIFFLKGETLNRLKRPSEAIVAYGEVVQRFGDSKSDKVCAQVALALNKKGDAFNQLKLQDKELAAYDEVVRRFGGNVALGVQVQVAHALINKGIALGRMDRSEEELAVYDDVLRRFGDTNITAILEVISQALLYKASLLIQSKRYEEAITTCEDIEWRFSDDEIQAFQVEIARALVLKGAALVGLGQEQKAKMIWKEAVRRFELSEDAELSLIVSMAVLQIAELAKKQGQFDETITTIGQLFERDINQALHQRCEGLLIRTHAFVALGDAVQAERDIEAALALLPDFGDLLGAAIDVLIDFTILQGPQHAKKIIQASPSIEQFVPFTIAIDKELGNEPRVAREIEEVAEDIRRDLENRQKRNN